MNVTVLGMHRSGTSLLANALCNAGLYCGESAELMAAREDNPLGFFERVDVVQLNDEILEQGGGSWYAPVELAEPITAPLSQRTNDILSKLKGNQPWLIKDPRLALTWPVWKDCLRETIKIFVYRDPGAVAHSLHTRNQFPLAFGFALWESYNRHILQALSGQDFIAVSFEELSREPTATLQHFFSNLGQLGA